VVGPTVKSVERTEIQIDGGGYQSNLQPPSGQAAEQGCSTIAESVHSSQFAFLPHIHPRPAMGSRRRRSAAACLFVLLAAAAGLPACSSRYDFERKQYQRQSLGQELFEIWRREADRSPSKSDARTAMLDREHDPFVRGVNTVVPADRLQNFDHYLRNSRGPMESGLLPSFSRKLETTLRSAAADQQLADALASDRRLAARYYMGAGYQPNLLGHLLAYERMPGLVTEVGDVLLDADGLDARGRRVSEESRAFFELQRTLADGLREFEAGGDASAQIEPRNILLREDGRFQVDSRNTTLPAVQFDRRGYPLVRRNGAGEPRFPFVDRNGDGLADVDDQGQFVLDGTQSARKVIPFDRDSTSTAFGRDDRGRATISGDFVFEYIDLSNTGAHFLARRLGDLHRDDILWKLADGLPPALGERTELSDEHGTYQGYPEDHPLTSVLTSAIRIFDLEQLPEAARGLARFIDTSRRDIATLIGAVGSVQQTIENHPEAELSEDSTIGYDLLPLVEEISADPELWSDVLKALRKPVIAELGKPFATMLTYADRETVPEEGGPYETCVQECKAEAAGNSSEYHYRGIGTMERFQCIRDCPTDELFSHKTDFSAPESPENRSVSAQIFHLLRDTSGTPYELRVTEASAAGINLSELPPIISLPGAAEAFIATIAGNLQIKNYFADNFQKGSLLGDALNLIGFDTSNLADLLSSMSPLFGTELDPRPTPGQITRMFNQSDLKFDNGVVTLDLNEPVCKDGYVMANHLADKLYASEASGLIDAIQPLAKAFTDHDRADLLAELFVVIHRHYSAKEALYRQKNGRPSPMKGADFASFEPALLEIAESGEVFEALQELAEAIDRAKPVDGVPVEEHLRKVVHNAVDRSDNYSPDHVSLPLELPDGQEIEDPSRLHVLIHALGRLDDRLDDRPDAREKLGEAVTAVAEAFGSTTEDESGRHTLDQPGTLALTSLALREFSSTAGAWKEEGTMRTTIAARWPDEAAEFVQSRTLPALVDLVEMLAETSERRELVDGLVAHLSETTAARDQVASGLYTILLQQVDTTSWAPLARFVGDVLAPSRTWEVSERKNLPFASHALELAQRMTDTEDGHVGIATVRRGTERIENGESAFGAIADVFMNYYRQQPDEQAPFDARDYRQSFAGLAAWLGDDAHGLEQIYDILNGSADASD
jgi:hypothetical protein